MSAVGERDRERARDYGPCTVGACCALGFTCTRHEHVANALADERERGARIADEHAGFAVYAEHKRMALSIAAAIRASARVAKGEGSGG